VVRVLTDAGVRRCLSIEDAIGALEAAFLDRSRGDVVEGRLDLALPNGWMRFMPCALTGRGIAGYKEFHLIRLEDAPGPTAAVRYTLNLFSLTTGELLAMMDAAFLTAIRTAASAAVAARHMAPEGTGRVGVIGSGWEARTQLEALSRVLPITAVKVFSRSDERRARFAVEMGERLGIDVQPVERPEETVPAGGTLVVATNTGGVGPALLGEWLRPGVHVSSIGSTSPRQREIDPDVWRRADRIVLDSRRVLEDSGDAIAARAEGALDEERILELHDVVAGTRPGRSSREELTLYKSIGMAMQDVAVAARALERAEELGAGTEAADHQSVKLVEPN
jgi:alanine dehydrogenase